MKIQKGVKIPKKKGELSEALSEMEVGDSILLKNDAEYNAVWAWFKRHGKKCQRLKEGEGKIRVWRVE